MTEIQGKSSSVRVSARFRDGEGSSYRESTVFFSYGRTQDALCVNAGGLLPGELAARSGTEFR